MKYMNEFFTHHAFGDVSKKPWTTKEAYNMQRSMLAGFHDESNKKWEKLRELVYKRAPKLKLDHNPSSLSPVAVETLLEYDLQLLALCFMAPTMDAKELKEMEKGKSMTSSDIHRLMIQREIEDDFRTRWPYNLLPPAVRDLAPTIDMTSNRDGAASPTKGRGAARGGGTTRRRSTSPIEGLETDRGLSAAKKKLKTEMKKEKSPSPSPDPPKKSAPALKSAATKGQDRTSKSKSKSPERLDLVTSPSPPPSNSKKPPAKKQPPAKKATAEKKRKVEEEEEERHEDDMHDDDDDVRPEGRPSKKSKSSHRSPNRSPSKSGMLAQLMQQMMEHQQQQQQQSTLHQQAMLVALNRLASPSVSQNTTPPATPPHVAAAAAPVTPTPDTRTPFNRLPVDVEQQRRAAEAAGLDMHRFAQYQYATGYSNQAADWQAMMRTPYQQQQPMMQPQQMYQQPPMQPQQMYQQPMMQPQQMYQQPPMQPQQMPQVSLNCNVVSN